MGVDGYNMVYGHGGTQKTIHVETKMGLQALNWAPWPGKFPRASVQARQGVTNLFYWEFGSHISGPIQFFAI